MQIKAGAIKSFNDVLTGCKGDQDGTIVTDKSAKVSSNNKYASFELDSSLCYIPSGDYKLETNTSNLLSIFETDGGCMDEDAYSLGGSGNVDISTTAPKQTTATTSSSSKTTTTTTSTVATTTTSQLGTEPASRGNGDVNCDGNVNILDVIVLNKNLLGGGQISADGISNADVDLDGTPSVADSLTILKYIISLVDALPIK